MPGIDSYTKLLLHFDGADTSTTFTDSSPSARTVTPAGNAQIDTGQAKWDGSGQFDGSGDKLTIADHADLRMDSGNFTIDCWVRPDALGPATILNKSGLSGTSFAHYNLGISATGQISSEFAIPGAPGTFIDGLYSSTLLATGAWRHLAVTKAANVYRLFIDGTQEATFTNATVPSDASGRALTIAYEENPGVRYFNGRIEELRVSKGIARWVANFTPPDRPYTYLNTAVQNYRRRMAA